MKNAVLPLSFFAALACGAASAQSSTGTRVQFEAPSGPVTVTSIQPPLPNAAHYRIGIADLDRNGDGYIQRAEVPDEHALSSEFKLVDRNRDGRISADELANWK